MNRFSGQTAVITGGLSGLGLAITRRLMAEGAFVAVVEVKTSGDQALRQEIETSGVCLGADVSDEGQVEAAIEWVVKTRGQIDVLVNSAGITGKTNLKSHEVAADDFDSVMRVNVRGSFLTAKHVLPVMLQRKYGRILHIASIAGKDGNAGMVAYSASKAAVIGMTKAQGKEYAESGITVNALAPAVIKTPIHDTMPAEQIRYMTDRIPMKRCGTVGEFAAMASFIVSPEASFTTGFAFDLSGGRAVY